MMSVLGETPYFSYPLLCNKPGQDLVTQDNENVLSLMILWAYQAVLLLNLVLAAMRGELEGP